MSRFKGMHSNKDQTKTTERQLGDDPVLGDFFPDVSDGYIATAGKTLANANGPVDLIFVEDALKSVHDPEIPNISAQAGGSL